MITWGMEFPEVNVVDEGDVVGRMPVLSVGDEIKVSFLDESVDDGNDLSPVVFRRTVR